MLPSLLLGVALTLAGILNDAAMGTQIAQERGTGGCTVNGVSYDSGHTMCLSKASDMVPMPLRQGEQQLVVDTHNDYRANVNPVASNMMKTYWDDAIAEVAQAWAETCTFGHDSDRSVPKYADIHIGQNGYFVSSNGDIDFKAAVDLWHDEEADFSYGNANKLQEVGHYTQMVWAESLALGCGAAYCGEKGKVYFFCNYAHQQMSDSFNTPYDQDDEGCTTTCPEHCVDGLCDCGDKICLHDGSLNPATCGCECHAIYTGDRCQTLDCPASESCTYDPNFCANFVIVQAACPYTCGICS